MDKLMAELGAGVWAFVWAEYWAAWMAVESDKWRVSGLDSPRADSGAS